MDIHLANVHDRHRISLPKSTTNCANCAHERVPDLLRAIGMMVKTTKCVCACAFMYVCVYVWPRDLRKIIRLGPLRPSSSVPWAPPFLHDKVVRTGKELRESRNLHILFRGGRAGASAPCFFCRLQICRRFLLVTNQFWPQISFSSIWHARLLSYSNTATLPFVVCRLSFVVCRLSFVVCRSCALKAKASFRFHSEAFKIARYLLCSRSINAGSVFKSCTTVVCSCVLLSGLTAPPPPCIANRFACAEAICCRVPLLTAASAACTSGAGAPSTDGGGACRPPLITSPVAW